MKPGPVTSRSLKLEKVWGKSYVLQTQMAIGKADSRGGGSIKSQDPWVELNGSSDIDTTS